MSSAKPKEQTAHQPKTKYAFDVSKPIKTGYLRKQGKVTKTMKERFFVLYPNFLVYYSDATKWGFDKTVGNLRSRKDALKLTGSTVSIPPASEVTGSFKYPFTINAPDLTNDKSVYILDTTSGEERKGWMDSISSSCKSSA